MADAQLPKATMADVKRINPPAVKWTGFPKYNFVGGHNDEARAPMVKSAQQLAYDVLQQVDFDGAQYRRDIGHRALKG